MTDREDTLYAKPQKLVDFEFDERVAAVFPDMIRRSVPGYGNIVAGIGLFAERYALPGSRCYDLGCSLGAATLSMVRRLTPDVEVVAVDNAPAMVARCREVIAAEESLVPVEVVEADINDVAIEDASMVVLNFTLQFIAPAQRLTLLRKIADGLRPGGILVLSEKIRFDDPEEQAMQEAMQIGFKRANGYSEMEISQKRTALEKVLLPDTLAQHAERLREAGFRSSHVWFRQFNFASLVAFR